MEIYKCYLRRCDSIRNVSPWLSWPCCFQNFNVFILHKWVVNLAAMFMVFDFDHFPDDPGLEFYHVVFREKYLLLERILIEISLFVSV